MQGMTLRRVVTNLAGWAGSCLAVFRYNAGQDVVVVDEQSYNDCVDPDNARVLTSGNDHVVLGQSGKFFFICDAEGECESGMKLAVNVH
jgi:hypothetical protein